jgi:hypothetical protein
MHTRVVDFNEYKARKAAEQRERVVAGVAPMSGHRSYAYGMNRWLPDPESSDCGCVNGQARWFQS